MKTLHACLAFLLICVSISCLSSVSAVAYEDEVRSYNQQSTINTYNRNGAFNGTWASGVSAQYWVKCSNGTWSNKNASGICYYAGSDSCWNGCHITWPQRNALTSDISVSRANPCHAKMCWGENTDAPGSASNLEITNRPANDDMLAIIPGGDGYLEFVTSYDNLSVGTIHWLKRIGGLNKNLMIPTKKDDYLGFLSHGGSVLHVETACMPANFNAVCPSPPSCHCPPPPP